MDTFEILKFNLLSPIVLAFLLGMLTKLIRSELSLPKDLYSSLSIYLLLSLGLKGGVELSESTLNIIILPALATFALGCFTPISSYFLLRKLGKFGRADAAAMAAHYGSVSAVTFIACTQFVSSTGHPSEAFMSTLLTLLESPGIHIALAIGALKCSKSKEASEKNKSKSKSAIFHEILTSRSMVLLVGGLLIGLLMGTKRYEPIRSFYEGGFKGALVLFLLEMGILAAERFSDLKKVGFKLIAMGFILPLFHGTLGVLLGSLSHLSIGGATVLGAMAASASYIAAPPAVRISLPQANPTYYLTTSLAITFPFNLIVGIPLYYELSVWIHSIIS